MELQFHPASGRRTVRTLAAGPVGEWMAVLIAAAVALAAASMWITVPSFVARSVREAERARMAEQQRRAAAETAAVADMAESLRARCLALADRLNRIAFLYDVAPAAWPRVLNPQRGWLPAGSPEVLADRAASYIRALGRAWGILFAREAESPSLADAVPSIVPLEAGLFEPAARFGPRVSPWTGEEEFFPGVDIAAPAGSSVLAAGSGTVAFVGRVRRTPGGWLWRLGNVVVISHERAGATVYGHLDRVGVRVGQTVRRGDRLGTVGTSGWAVSPQLHYEFWRRGGGGLRPTDPLFASLDNTTGSRFSLEQMLGTSAPGSLEPLPGIQVSAAAARGSAEPRSVRRPQRRPRRV